MQLHFQTYYNQVYQKKFLQLLEVRLNFGSLLHMQHWASLVAWNIKVKTFATSPTFQFITAGRRLANTA